MNASRDHAPSTCALRPQEPQSPTICADLCSGDLLCPMCGEPMEVAIERTEYGAQPVGRCADCISTVDLA